MATGLIVHVINSIGLGGVPESAYHLLRTLPRDRFDLRLHVLKPPSAADADRQERLRRFEALGIPVSFGRPREHKLAAVSDLVTVLNEDLPAIVHTHSYKPNLYARLAATLFHPAGVRIVAHYHNQYDEAWQRDGSLDLDRALTRGTDRVVACSGVVADHVADRLGVPRPRIAVVPNGVDCARFSPVGNKAQVRAALGLPQEGPLVGLVGRICAQKGQEDLVAAFPAVLARCPGVHAVLAGAPDETASLERLRAQVESLGLADRIHLFGYVADVTRVYAALDVLVAPSRWEGFGLMLVEAMAAGLPIVATRVGAIPEVLGDAGAGLLVPPGDGEALARAIVEVLAEAGRAGAMAEAGVQRARSFDWSRSGAALAGLYDDLLKNGEPR